MNHAHPRLRPGTRALRRTDGSIQVGLEGAGGVVVAGLGPSGLRLVRSLDGTATLDQVRARADALGVAPSRLTDLLSALDRHGHLVTGVTRPPGAAAPLPPSPRPVQVAVDGCGPAAGALTDLLTRAGVRVVAGAHLLGAILSAVGPEETTRPAPPAVVLLRRDALDARLAAGLAHAGIPHLPVVLGPGTLLVGPLVDGTGPCLECCDLTRRDLDPGWAGVHAQLLPVGVSPATPIGSGGALDAIAASLATMVLLAHLDGEPDRPGVSHEVRLPWPRVVARQWHPHPMCSCRDQPHPRQRGDRSSVTMVG